MAISLAILLSRPLNYILINDSFMRYVTYEICPFIYYCNIGTPDPSVDPGLRMSSSALCANNICIKLAGSLSTTTRRTDNRQ